MALVAIALMVADLIRVVDENNTDTAFVWENRLTSLRDWVANIVPLTSIKIVVVVWQIVTQVNAAAVYSTATMQFGKATAQANDALEHRTLE